MKPRCFLATLGLTVLSLLGGGCQKKEELVQAKEVPLAKTEKKLVIEAVPEAERSRHFEAVNKHLELGGSMYGYVDIDGDALKIAEYLGMMATRVSEQQPAVAPYLKQDYSALMGDLGFCNVKALGLSSVRGKEGLFRNNVFLYMPEGRRGLFSVLGGAAAPFDLARNAPADTDLFTEGEVDLPALYSVVKTVVTRFGGATAANKMEESLGMAGSQAGFSALKLINGFKGRSSMVLRLDPEKTFVLPGKKAVRVPAFSLLLRVEGIAPALQAALERLPFFVQSKQEALQYFVMKEALPVGGLKPVIVLDGTTLWFASSQAFFDECRKPVASLFDNPTYSQLLSKLGNTGNGISYESPRLFARLGELAKLNPRMDPQIGFVLESIARGMPKLDKPIMLVRTNLPDGILIHGLYHRSLKQEMAMITIYNPVTIGLMAGMAVPAFQKVRFASQEKAILNNLRQLGAAADQYYLEQGVSTATYDDLVGPGKYIKELAVISGENYRALNFKQGTPLRVRTADGRSIEYAP